MNKIEQVLKEEIDALMEDLASSHIRLGMKASGNWLKQLESHIVTVGNSYSGQILGTFYTYQLIHGRKSGKRPPSKMIEEWIRDKGIKPKDISIKSLAFLIARKIGEFGTQYYRQGGTSLISSVVTTQRVELIINRVQEAYLETYVEDLADRINETLTTI